MKKKEFAEARYMKKQELIKRYIRGILVGKEANQLEREGLSDPFLYEGLEGLEQVEGDHIKVVEELERRMERGTKSPWNFRWVYYSGITAACILFAVLACWLIYRSQDRECAVRLAETKVGLREEQATEEIPQAPQTSGEVAEEQTEHKLSVQKRKNLSWSVALRKSVGQRKPDKTEERLVTDGKEVPLAGILSKKENVSGRAVTDTNFMERQTKLLAVPATGKVHMVGAEDTVELSGPQVLEFRNRAAAGNRRKGVRKKTIYPGAERNFARYVADSLRYPEDARELQLEGEVILTVHLNKKGRPSRIKVLRKLSRSCDREAIRLVEEFKGDWGEDSRNFTVKVFFRLSAVKD